MAVNYENPPGAGSAPPPRGVDFANVRDLRIAGPLDATLPPTPIRELLAASGATVFVLASDANFIATIRRAAEQHPLFVVESWAELVEAAEAGSCGIALLDATLLGARLPQCVARLAEYHDRLVTLVAADRTTAQEYVGLLSTGRIHRLLIKPAAIGAARLLIESATARRLQLRDEALQGSVPAAVAVSSRVPKWVWGTVAGVGAIALLAAAFAGVGLDLWNRSSGTEASAPAEATAAPETAPPPVDELAELRAKASVALTEGRLAEPAGDNALDLNLAVLARAPGDQAARDALSSVMDGLFKRAEGALLADDLGSAAAALDQVRRVDPASSRLAFLDAQLARGLAVLAAAPPKPTVSPQPVAASPTELDSVLSLATARLRRGQILAPGGDSAVAYLDRAAQLGPTDPRVGALRGDVSAALVSAARLVFDSDIASAANLAVQARRLGVDSPALVALEADIGTALGREKQQQLADRLGTARQRLASGALFAPANDSAFDYLTGLQAEAPALAGLAEEWEAFRQAAVLSIGGSIDRGEWATADNQLARLAQAPAGAIAAQPLAAELASRRLQETYLATAAPASVMKLQSSVPAVYPAELLQRAVEGWVELELVVDRNGRPRDVVVKQAQPAGRFDAAAVTAVQQYRFVPFEQDGRVYERRLSMRVRFKVQ
jgi:periplasmic protein TonB